MSAPALTSEKDRHSAVKAEKNILLVINELCDKLVPF